MNTFLDLLILVVLALTALSLVAMVLMFLIRNHKIRRVCLYLVAALDIYVSFVAFRIMWPNFLTQSFFAVLAALTAASSIAVERLSKGNAKKFLLARIMAALALITAMLAAFV